MNSDQQSGFWDNAERTIRQTVGNDFLANRSGQNISFPSPNDLAHGLSGIPYQSPIQGHTPSGPSLSQVRVPPSTTRLSNRSEPDVHLSNAYPWVRPPPQMLLSEMDETQRNSVLGMFQRAPTTVAKSPKEYQPMVLKNVPPRDSSSEGRLSSLSREESNIPSLSHTQGNSRFVPGDLVANQPIQPQLGSMHKGVCSTLGCNFVVQVEGHCKCEFCLGINHDVFTCPSCSMLSPGAFDRILKILQGLAGYWSAVFIRAFNHHCRYAT